MYGRPFRPTSHSFGSRFCALSAVYRGVSTNSLALVSHPPTIRRPGDIIDQKTFLRQWWSVPAVGFNAILEIPIYQFEVLNENGPDIDLLVNSEHSLPAQEVAQIVVPNDVFGSIIRKDLLHKAYLFHRRAMAGYQEDMQLYKWEWVGSNKKFRDQARSGKSRMGRRKAPGKYDGVFSNPLRPRDWRQSINRRVLWSCLKMCLSSKFAQNQLIVVDSFNVSSHKTRLVVQHFRRLVGTRCNSVLCVHEGGRDVNDNFRWATAHIAAVRREDVEGEHSCVGVTVYNLLKYRYLIITEKALRKLIWYIQTYPVRRGWLPKSATPDGQPAPRPEKVPGWNDKWIERKDRLRHAEFRQKELFEERRKWKWSTEIRGPLKIPRYDNLESFRVHDVSAVPSSGTRFLWARNELQEQYLDDSEPLEGEDAAEAEYFDVGSWGV